MKRNSILIVGCGDLGIRTGKALCAAGWQVHGLRRNRAALPEQFVAHQGDYASPGDLGFLRDLRPDFLLVTCNPSDRSAEGYRRGFVAAAENLLASLEGHRPRRLLFVSSTRVFAESAGGWVEEGSPLVTGDDRAQAIIEAEHLLLDAPLAATVVRFGGIYGDPQGRLLSRLARGDLCDPTPGHWSNRIHRQDCAGFLIHLLRAAAGGAVLEPVYIGVDNQPALQYEVESWLARQLGQPLANAGFAGGDGHVGGKRCSNRLLSASGYRLRFPDYHSGYRAVLAAADAS